MKKAAFIGVGNMGGALARAACRAVGPEQVVLVNRTPAKAEALAAELGCAAAKSNADAVRAAEYVFLGVKPQMMRPLLNTLAPVLAECSESRVLVSMAAGLRIDDMRPHLNGAGYDVPVVRIMPNTCVAIGKGMTAVCTEDWVDVRAADFVDILRILLFWRKMRIIYVLLRKMRKIFIARLIRRCPVCRLAIRQ